MLQAHKTGHMISILQSLRTLHPPRAALPPLLAAQERQLQTLLAELAKRQQSSDQPWCDYSLRVAVVRAAACSLQCSYTYVVCWSGVKG